MIFSEGDIGLAAGRLGIPERDLRAWAEGEGRARLEFFLRSISGLSQRKVMRECDILAFLWSLCHDPSFLGMEARERRRSVLSLLRSLSALSPAEAAVVAVGMKGFREYSARAGDGEDIRRRLLLMDPYDPPAGGPLGRLRGMAARDFRRTALALAGKSVPADHALVLVDAFANRRISVSGAGAFYVREEPESPAGMGSRIWHPCIVTSRGDPHLVLVELAAMAAACDGAAMRDREGRMLAGPQETGFGIVLGISESSYRISAEIVERGEYAKLMDPALSAVSDFFKENVDGGIPWNPDADRRKAALPGAARARLEELSERAATLRIAAARATEMSADAARELMSFLGRQAADRGIPLDRLAIPQSAMRIVRQKKIDFDALERIGRRRPEEFRRIVAEGAHRAVPDPELMKEALERRGVPKEEWCRAELSVALVREACERLGIAAPIESYCQLAVSPGIRSEKARADAGRILAMMEGGDA